MFWDLWFTHATGQTRGSRHSKRRRWRPGRFPTQQPTSREMNVTNCILVQEEWAPLAVPHVISSIELCWRSFLRNVWLYKSKSYPVIMSQYVTCMLHIVRETYCLDRAKFTKNISCFETCGSPTPQENETQDGGNGDNAINPEKVGEVLSRHNSQAAELRILKSYRFYTIYIYI